MKAVILFAGICSLCLHLSPVSGSDPAKFRQGVVAADHAAASEAGAEMLRRGGNVVDAAVATSFALSVVRPASCGIGGGGYMVIWDEKSQKAIVIDYRERAPQWASPELYEGLEETTHAEAANVRGGLACGIPGTVAGLCYAAETYGSLPLPVLLEPALRLCEEGVEIDAHDVEVQKSTLDKFEQFPGYRQRYEPLLRLYLNQGRPWQKGDRFRSPQKLALERISRDGPRGFYAGPTAAELVSVVGQHGGRLQENDLNVSIPVERSALTGEFHGFRVITMPPPSSGGIALLECLGTLAAWEKREQRALDSLGHNSPDYVHVVTEAMKHAFADRAEYLGDTDYVDVPVARLLSAENAEQTAARIDLTKTMPPEHYGRFGAGDDSGTSHFSVVDQQGNAVACTETINLTFGSFVVLPESGVLLNNQMDDFAAQPGKPNAFGLIQSAANAVQPGKKPLSSMTPTILLRDGKATFACGGSGGPRIISATLQTVLNYSVFGRTPADAVAAPRFHHQWSPNEILVERTLSTSLTPLLEERGHVVKNSGGLAAVQAASRSIAGSEPELQGGSDPRKHGVPAGH